jgi:hypothetical protein
MRFLTEANLTQVIRRAEGNSDAGEARTQLNDRIKEIFGGAALEAAPFPGGPWDVPDEIGNGRPLLVVLSYEASSVGASVDSIPDLITRIYERKGAEGGSLRQLRNNLVFAVADESRVDEMKRQMIRRLALRDLKSPERLAELAEHQQAKVRELEGRSETEVAIAIQQCFRHLLYPSRNRMPGAAVDLAHSAFEIRRMAGPWAMCWPSPRGVRSPMRSVVRKAMNDCNAPMKRASRPVRRQSPSYSGTSPL